MRTDGLTDTTKLTVSFRNVAKAPNKTSTRTERPLYSSLVFCPVKLNTMPIKFSLFVFPIYDRYFYVCEATRVSRAVGA